MKKRNRLSRWLLRFYWNFTSSVKKNVELEVKRYSDYLNENYIPSEQLRIYKQLQARLIVLHEEKIKERIIENIQGQEEQKYLEDNLKKLKALIPDQN